MSIFEDSDKMLENSRESAKALGFNVPKMVKKKVNIAKKKCRICYGGGVLTQSFPGNRGDDRIQKVFCSCVIEKEIEVPEI